MMCQRIGRDPMFTIGLGIVSENSRIRNPCPPQKRTTFIETSLVQNADVVACGRCRSYDHRGTFFHLSENPPSPWFFLCFRRTACDRKSPNGATAKCNVGR